MYSGTWLSDWRCSGSIVSYLETILAEIGRVKEPICLLGIDTGGCPRFAVGSRTWVFLLTLFLLFLVGRWAGVIARYKFARADDRRIKFAALIDIDKRRVGRLDDVGSGFHFFAV